MDNIMIMNDPSYVIMLAERGVCNLINSTKYFIYKNLFKQKNVPIFMIDMKKNKVCDSFYNNIRKRFKKFISY